jgi:hypothetical protein
LDVGENHLGINSVVSDHPCKQKILLERTIKQCCGAGAKIKLPAEAKLRITAPHLDFYRFIKDFKKL